MRRSRPGDLWVKVVAIVAVMSAVMMALMVWQAVQPSALPGVDVGSAGAPAAADSYLVVNGHAAVAPVSSPSPTPTGRLALCAP